MIWRKRMHENTLRLHFFKFIYYRDQMKNNPTQTHTPMCSVCEELEHILIRKYFEVEIRERKKNLGNN